MELPKESSVTNLHAIYVMFAFNTPLSELLLAVKIESRLNLAADSVSVRAMIAASSTDQSCNFKIL